MIRPARCVRRGGCAPIQVDAMSNFDWRNARSPPAVRDSDKMRGMIAGAGGGARLRSCRDLAVLTSAVLVEQLLAHGDGAGFLGQQVLERAVVVGIAGTQVEHGHLIAAAGLERGDGGGGVL